MPADDRESPTPTGAEASSPEPRSAGSLDEQLQAAMDRAAIRFMGQLDATDEQGEPILSLREQIDVFQKCHGWLTARKRLNKGKGVEDDAPGIQAMKDAIKELAQQGELPPPRRVGRPSNAERVVRQEYEAQVHRRVEKERANDDSKLRRMIQAAAKPAQEGA